MNAPHPAQPGQYLTFRVGDEEYGVPILRVREILRFEGVTRVPAAPRAVRGVINLRGSVVPVVDLRLKLGLPPADPGPRACIVVVEADVEGECLSVGLLADAVNRVAEFGAGEIEPTPRFGTRVRAEGLLGLGRTAKHFVPILDLECLLAGDELHVAPPAEAAAGDEPGAAPEEEDAAALEEHLA